MLEGGGGKRCGQEEHAQDACACFRIASQETSAIEGNFRQMLATEMNTGGGGGGFKI